VGEATGAGAPGVAAAVVDAVVAPGWPPAAVEDGVADNAPPSEVAVGPAVEVLVFDVDAAVVVTGWLAASVPMMANMPEVLSPAVSTRAAAALCPRRRLGCRMVPDGLLACDRGSSVAGK